MAEIKQITDGKLVQLLGQFKQLNHQLSNLMNSAYQRTLPISELHNDRWERAERLGFGKGSNVYDSSYVFGNVKVGENCWIGMFTILDGSGGLTVGNHCTISAGVHIYSHDNLKATLCPEHHSIERVEVSIGDNCYLGPNAIISKGVSIGNHCVVAANSLVKDSFPSFSIIAGTPAKRIGTVSIVNGEVILTYVEKDK
jgi:acetyltransferase-like isoleucine patch superfamily enzyme